MTNELIIMSESSLPKTGLKMKKKKCGRIYKIFLCLKWV